MRGRADNGLFIITGKFTRDAIKEGPRDGVPAIDLIDGDLLCEKLKEFSLGVITELIEEEELLYLNGLRKYKGIQHIAT